MNRGKWTIDKDTGKLVPAGESKPRQQTPGIITDEICLESMVDGRIYTSKSKLRQHYKREGYVEKEKGYVPKRENPYESREYLERMEEDAARAYYAVRDNMAPLSELDRERCKIINHNMEHYNYDRRYYDDDGNPRD